MATFIGGDPIQGEPYVRRGRLGRKGRRQNGGYISDFATACVVPLFVRQLIGGGVVMQGRQLTSACRYAALNILPVPHGIGVDSEWVSVLEVGTPVLVQADHRLTMYQN